MDRRNFLKLVGAFAAGAALPVPFVQAKVARAPAWARYVLVFETPALKKGTYTFSCFVKNEGFYVAGVKAEGGETIVEVPWGSETAELFQPMLNTHGIRVDLPKNARRGARIDFTDVDAAIPKVSRGENNMLEEAIRKAGEDSKAWAVHRR